jgi:hypothetical protein
MAIDDETRARAMAAVKRRMAGEASDEDMESALEGMNPPTARRAAAKPATPTTSTPTRSSSAAPDTYGVPSLTPNADRTEQSSVNDRLERFASGFPGGSPLASIAAVAGPTAGGLARNTGRFLGSLGSSGRAAEATAAKSGPTKQGLREPAPFKRGRTRSESARDMELDEIRRTGRYAKGGSVSSASSRGDGIASKGKTRGRMC